MTNKTKIEWVRGDDGAAGLSWNALRARRREGGRPDVTANHCEHVNEACRFCYSDRINGRLGGLPFKPGHRKDYDFILDEKKLLDPLRIRTPRRIFVESVSDLFGAWWPRDFVDHSYAVMAICQQHTFINLSKRPAERLAYLADPEMPARVAKLAGDIRDKAIPGGPRNELSIREGLEAEPLPNVIEGTSVSCQSEANDFVPILMRTRAAVRVVSAEPLLGPIDFTEIRQLVSPGYFGDVLGWYHQPMCDAHIPYPKIGWMIVGGESGQSARPMHPDWARGIRDQCVAAGVPYFFKQHGEWIEVDGVRCQNIDQTTPGQRFWLDPDGTLVPNDKRGSFARSIYGPSCLVMRVGKKAAGRLLDGREWNEFPKMATRKEST